MKHIVWTAVIAASTAFAGTAAADNFTLLPSPSVHPYFSNGLSPPGRETCDFPQPCWDKLQDTPVVVAPAKRVIVRKAH
jgi:hypothetical protein